MMINPDFDINENIRKELYSQLENCKEKVNKNFYIIGLGGKESWLTTLIASDFFGPQNVLAVNIYSVFSNSILPHKIAGICQTYNIQYCDVDITNAVQETLSSNIGLFRVEKEKLHYMMTDLQKNEMIAMIRNTVLRGITDRHDGVLLTGISLSKILAGWVSPSCSMFDWNPLVNCSHYQVQLAISNSNMGMELLDLPSGLDLNTNGGPFPIDFGIKLEDNMSKDINIERLGYGIYQ